MCLHISIQNTVHERDRRTDKRTDTARRHRPIYAARRARAVVNGWMDGWMNYYGIFTAVVYILVKCLSTVSLQCVSEYCVQKCVAWLAVNRVTRGLVTSARITTAAPSHWTRAKFVAPREENWVSPESLSNPQFYCCGYWCCCCCSCLLLLCLRP